MSKKEFIIISITFFALITILGYKFYLNATNSNQLSKSDIEHLSKTVQLNETEYEKQLGIYKNNVVIASFSCSDVCPAANRTDIIYKNVNEAECEKLEGSPLNGGWGYIGCQPEEL